MKIQYMGFDFKPKTEATIDQANRIIGEYASQGFLLTLRQIYYQFVARGLIENTERSYKNLGKIISNARLAGLVDWNAIEDRTRSFIGDGPHWDTPDQVLREMAEGYTIDKWADQPAVIEVWVEKEALAGIISRVCRRLMVGWFVCRGYTSQSEMWRAAQRLIEYPSHKQIVVLHLGDHDPSGLDMSRDIESRLELFGADHIEFKRIALNMDQIDEINPPPNPAKLTDSRARDYVSFYGYESWELDALEPQYMSDLITNEVMPYKDPDAWAVAEAVEQEQRSHLQRIARQWDDVVDMFGGE